MIYDHPSISKIFESVFNTKRWKLSNMQEIENNKLIIRDKELAIYIEEDFSLPTFKSTIA